MHGVTTLRLIGRTEIAYDLGKLPWCGLESLKYFPIAWTSPDEADSHNSQAWLTARVGFARPCTAIPIHG